MAASSNDNRGCLLALLSALLGNKAARRALPYAVRDDFLSPAELSFYHVLCASLGESLVICPKVNLKDLFFVTQSSESQSYWNKINSKHVDFLVCEARSMRPMAGVELDDVSHGRADRQARDAFVDEVFRVTCLPLVRIRAQRTYNPQEVRNAVLGVISLPPRCSQNDGRSSVAPPPVPAVAVSGAPLCPKCNITMVARTTTRGEKPGSRFYGCANYPKCREIVPIE